MAAFVPVMCRELMHVKPGMEGDVRQCELLFTVPRLHEADSLVTACFTDCRTLAPFGYRINGEWFPVMLSVPSSSRVPLVCLALC